MINGSQLIRNPLIVDFKSPIWTESWQIVNIAVNLCRIINKVPTDVPTVVRVGVQTECAKVLQIVCNTVEIPVAFARRAGSLAA